MITAHDFDRDVRSAKRTADNEPVVITDRGRPSHVLLSFEQYERLVTDQRTLVDRLTVDDDVDVPRHRVVLPLKPPDL